MRYKVPITKLGDYHLPLLKEELVAAGIGVVGIYAGNGVVLIDTLTRLTTPERDAAKSVLLTHAPLFFPWTDNGITGRKPVRVAEDVDRITASRIRSLMARGEDEPFEAQFKLLTKLVEGLYIDIAQTTSLADFKSRAMDRAAPYASLLAERKAIIAEGRDFKIANNL